MIMILNLAEHRDLYCWLLITITTGFDKYKRHSEETPGLKIQSISLQN